MVKETLISKHLKSVASLPSPLKHMFSCVFSTVVLPISTLFPRLSAGFILFFMLFVGAVPALQAQSGKFEGDVEEEEGNTPTEYALAIETDGLTSGKSVTITATGTDVKGSNSSYTVKPATLVTVALTIPLPEDVTYVSLLGTSAKGNWFLNPLGNLPTTFSFKMPSSDITLRFGFKVEEKQTPDTDPDPLPQPDPQPTIYHNVTLPEVEGAVTDPAAGVYAVENWASLGFYLNLKKGYENSLPVVGTDRGETLTPGSQGKYWVKNVRSDVTVSIAGIQPDLPPVANEQIRRHGGLRIHTEPGQLCIDSPSDDRLYIYNIGGSPVKTARLTAGRHTIALPRGIYILRIGGNSYKVIL